MMKNKYTNKSLKKGNIHYHDYTDGLGYIEISEYSIFKILAIILLIAAIIIIGFHILTKFI